MCTDDPDLCAQMIPCPYLNVQTERPPVQGLAGFVALVCGCILLSLGLVDQGKFSEADPASDFTNVGTCKVLEVQYTEGEHQGKQGQDKGPVCTHIYDYRFEYNNATFWSREKHFEVGVGCEARAILPGSFYLEQDVPCWRTTSQVSEVYRCIYQGCDPEGCPGTKGEVCMTIFDPAEDVGEAKEGADARTIAGAVLLPIGILLLVAAVVARCSGASRKS